MGARKRSSLVKKWYLRYLIVVIAGIIALFGVTAYFKQDYERLSLQTVKARIDATAEFYNRILDTEMPMLYIASELRDLTKNQFYTATLFNHKGEVIFSHGSTAVEDQLGFQLNQQGNIQTTANQERIVSIDRKLLQEDTWVGTLRFSTSLRRLDYMYSEFVIGLWFVAFLFIGFLVLLSYVFMRSMVRPLIEMKNIAEVYAKGNFDVDMVISRNDEIGQLAETMQLMAKDLKHMEASKYQFIDTVSHELRTPMTSILGWCDLMEMRPEHSEKGIQMIKIETQRLGDLVSNLMAFNVMQTTSELKLSQFDLIELLEEVLLVFKPRMDRYAMTIEKIWESDALPIVTDRGKMKQVIVNILDNAMKFSEKNSSLRIGQELRSNGFKIWVEDEGPGILPEHLKQLTQKYFRGQTDKPGMGLGLAIVNDLMGLLNGVMRIESNIGEGTMVKLEFKLLEAESLEAVVKL
jgi:signal transduction histidine kinase